MDKKSVSEPSVILAKSAQNSQGLGDSEASAFLNDLEKDAKRREHQRRENARKNFHWCNTALIFVVYAIVIFSVIEWGLHFLLPLPYHFLPSEQIDTITTAICSSIATVCAKEFYKKNL
jgi:hypothetical protein